MHGLSELAYRPLKKYRGRNKRMLICLATDNKNSFYSVTCVSL